MSEFDGHLLEYPFISIDRFDKENYTSRIYLLSHLHKDHIEGLTDIEFSSRLQREQPNVKLYTSETTRNLMSTDDQAAHLLPYVVGLPIHQPVSIDLKDEKGEVRETIVVTLITAGHCIGSVMFLLEGSKGAVLYTGDFRLNLSTIQKVKCLHSGSQVIPLKSVYVDTTFLIPNMPDLPTRETTNDTIIDVIEGWISQGPHYMVHLKFKGKYGYEHIMQKVAHHFKTKIHAQDLRLKMSSMVPDLVEHFTTNPNETQIHCCYYGPKSTNSDYFLPCRLRQKNGVNVKMMTIIPSAMYFILKKKIPEGSKEWIADKQLMRVFHSMHASYNEIREVIGYLRVEDIYPFVPPADCKDIWTAYERLADLRSSSLYSSLPRQSSRTSFDNDDSAWKESVRKNIDATPRTVDARHKELGIFDDHQQLLSSPPPKRRKRRRKNDQASENLDEDDLIKENENLSSSIANQKSQKCEEPSYDQDELLRKAFECPSTRSHSLSNSHSKDDIDNLSTTKPDLCLNTYRSLTPDHIFESDEPKTDAYVNDNKNLDGVTLNSTGKSNASLLSSSDARIMSMPSEIFVSGPDKPVSVTSNSHEDDKEQQPTEYILSSDEEQNSQTFDDFPQNDAEQELNIIPVEECEITDSPLSSTDKELMLIPTCIVNNNPKEIDEANNIEAEQLSNTQNSVRNILDVAIKSPVVEPIILSTSSESAENLTNGTTFISPLNTLDKDMMSMKENELTESISVNVENARIDENEGLDTKNDCIMTMPSATNFQNKKNTIDNNFICSNIVSSLDTMKDDANPHHCVLTEEHISLDSVDQDIMSIKATGSVTNHVTHHVPPIIDVHGKSKVSKRVDLVVISDGEDNASDSDSDATIVGSSLDGSQDRSMYSI